MYRMTPEHRKKIGEANKRGRMVNCANCGNKFYLTPYEEKGKYPRKCCSKECFAERYRKIFAKHGSDNRFWKNGGWAYIKRQALIRDKYTCKKCGFKDKEIMEVDHIKEKVLGGKDTIENAQTLCPNCHTKKTNRFLKKHFLIH